MTDNLKELRNVYTIEDMVQICVKGDVVTAANAEYLRRNLGEFFGELNNALRESQYMYAELEEQLANNHTAVSVYQRDIAALRERVAALEALTDSVGILCEEMYGAEHLQPFPVDMIPEAAKQKMDAVLDAWGKTNELGALLYEQPRAFYAVANNLLETKADLWRKMADEGGE